MTRRKTDHSSPHRRHRRGTVSQPNQEDAARIDGATIMFAGNVAGVTQTLPLAVYAEFQSSLDASVAAAATLVGAAFAVSFGVHLLRIDAARRSD